MREIGRRQALSRFGAVALAGLGAAGLGGAGLGGAGRESARLDGRATSARGPGTVLWRRQAGGSAADQTPLIVAGYGRAYEAGNAEKDGDASTYAIDAASGALVWRTHGASGPLVYAAGPGAVYGCQVSGGTTNVIALSAATGKPLWVHDAGRLLGNAGTGWLGYAGQLVYLATGVGVIAEPGNSSVHALDAKTGRPVWATALNSPAQEPAVADGTVYASTNAGVVALSATSGKRRWTAGDVAGRGKNFGLLYVADGVVCGDTVGGAFGLDADTGHLLWYAKVGVLAAATSSVAIWSGFKGADLLVQALHTASGKPAWTRTFARFANVLDAVDGVLYIGGASYGELLAVSAATGQTRWTSRLGAPVTSLAVASGVVYAVDINGMVYAIAA